MTAPTQSIETVRRQAIRIWLDEQFTFTHFITLASNSSDVSLDVMKDRLKGWDARVNRELYGPKWLKHYDELLWFFAFLEKPDVNPHWHLLCRFTDTDKLARFTPVAGMKWSKMLPMGTVDVQQITEKHSRVVDYVVKRVGGEIEYRNFITPDEFRHSRRSGYCVYPFATLRTKRAPTGSERVDQAQRSSVSSRGSYPGDCKLLLKLLAQPASEPGSHRTWRRSRRGASAPQ